MTLKENNKNILMITMKMMKMNNNNTFIKLNLSLLVL